MRACEELDGIPKYHVMTFQMMAPSSPPRITFGFTMLCSIMPPPIALATASDPVNAAAKLNTAAQRTAASGLSTRVPTMVAIEFAESWKPLLKSKMNAITTIATTYPITRDSSGVLERNALQHLGDTHAAVDRTLERVVHLLPFDDVERIGIAREQCADRLVVDRVALLLQMLDQGDVLIHGRWFAHLPNRDLNLVRGSQQHA